MYDIHRINQRGLVTYHFFTQILEVCIGNLTVSWLKQKPNLRGYAFLFFYIFSRKKKKEEIEYILRNTILSENTEIVKICN